MASLRLVGVHKQFDLDRPRRGRGARSGDPATRRVEALQGIDLEVADGESVTVVGPSGSGKTTLLRVAAGLEAVTSGSVLIGDRDVTEVAGGERNVSMVFQSYALFPHLTVADNIGFGLAVRRVDKIVAAVCGEAAPRRVVRACSTGVRSSCREENASGSPWPGPWCATRTCSCSTSPCRTSTPSCASRCGPSWRTCTAPSDARWCTSPTTRSRRSPSAIGWP
jgi:ABC-type sugar transport system ATPase subunit